MARLRIPALVLIADLVAVVVFAAVGRLSHDEGGLVGLVAAATPFAVGAVAAWAVPWSRAEPLGLRAGALTVGVTAALGLLLRWAFTGGVPQWPFPVVTVVSLAVLMLGWRGLAVLTRSRVARGPARR